jgi:beta-glucuronidase
MLFMAFMPHSLAAQEVSSSPVLSAADLRSGQVLDGEWTWSIDPYGDGLAGFHGGQAGTGHRRYDDVDVQEARAADPLALYEYDMDRSPTAILPSSWLTHAPEMRHYQGLVWYQKRFDAEFLLDSRFFLYFGAVNYTADVWLNGTYLGHHEGGFTPFVLEARDLRLEDNRLVIAVDSTRTEASVPPPVTDWETYGGITRSVKLISVHPTFVDDAWVRLTKDGRIAADVRFNGIGAAGRKAKLEIPELGLSETVRMGEDGAAHVEFAAPAGLERWSPDNPKLYDVNIVIDAEPNDLAPLWHDRIGFKTIETRGSQILLNGEPIFLRGISIHEEEIGPDPTRNITPEAARELLSLVKDGLNGNFVRLAHYPHCEVMLRAADEMGLLVWSEIPVYWRIDWENPDTLAVARTMLAENIIRDRNRAAIALWSVGNETPVTDARNIFMSRLVADVRSLDDTRLVTAALLTERNEDEGHPVLTLADPLASEVDVLAVNTYNGWYGPDRPNELSRIEWRMPEDRPLIFSELGAGAKLGLREPEDPHKFSEDYQAEYYRHTLAMAETIPSLAGLSPWILKDFRSPRRQLPVVQDGWNRKGLVSELGEPKLAFSVLSNWYAARQDEE